MSISKDIKEIFVIKLFESDEASELTNQAARYIEALQKELDAANAHIAEMVSVIETDINKTGGNLRLEGLLVKTPAQSLASIQADAIHKAIEKCRVAQTDTGDKWLCRVVDLEEYSNNLINQPTN